MIISYKGKTQNFIKEIIAVFYKLKKKIRISIELCELLESCRETF